MPQKYRLPASTRNRPPWTSRSSSIRKPISPRLANVSSTAHDGPNNSTRVIITDCIGISPWELQQPEFDVTGFGLDRLRGRALHRMPPEADERLAVAIKPLDVKRMPARRASAAIDLGLDVPDPLIGQHDPFMPANRLGCRLFLP